MRYSELNKEKEKEIKEDYIYLFISSFPEANLLFDELMRTMFDLDVLMTSVAH